MVCEEDKIFNKKILTKIRQELRSKPTSQESLLWKRLKGRQLNGLKFRRQYGIGKYVVDFYCPEKKLAIEIDGDSHYNEQAERSDIDRDSYLESLGVKIIRFTNKEAMNKIEGVFEEIIRMA